MVLGVAAVALLTHARRAKADCAYTPEVLTLELESVTANGQVVADRAPWQRNALEVASNYPGTASLSVWVDAGLPRQLNVRLVPGP